MRQRLSRNGFSLDAETLLGDDIEPFESALSPPFPASVAVVGDPFSERSTVLDVAERRLDAHRLDIRSLDAPRTLIDAIDSTPLVIDNCQHLFTRNVGGFAPLTAFLDALSNTDAPVVMGWNRYAWSYLTAVIGLDADIETAVTIDGLSSEQMADLALTELDSVPTFRRDDLDESLVTVKRYSLRGDRTVPIPIPNRPALEARRADRPSPQDAVFDRLTTVSNGNPSAAIALLRQGQTDGEIRPSDLDPPARETTRSREEAFCLRIVLSKETVRRQWLADRFGERFDRMLGRLDRAGFLDSDDDVVRLKPAGLPAVIEITERERIL